MIIGRMTEIMKLSINDEVSPRMDLNKNPGRYRRHNVLKQPMSTAWSRGREADMLMPKDEVPRIKEIKGKVTRLRRR